jgi:hypothetical protein
MLGQDIPSERQQDTLASRFIGSSVIASESMWRAILQHNLKSTISERTYPGSRLVPLEISHLISNLQPIRRPVGTEFVESTASYRQMETKLAHSGTFGQI